MYLCLVLCTVHVDRLVLRTRYEVLCKNSPIPKREKADSPYSPWIGALCPQYLRISTMAFRQWPWACFFSSVSKNIVMAGHICQIATLQSWSLRGSSQGNLVQPLEDMTGIIGARTPGRMCDWMASRYATGLAGTGGYAFSRDGWWVVMAYTYQKGSFLQLD